MRIGTAAPRPKRRSKTEPKPRFVVFRWTHRRKKVSTSSPENPPKEGWCLRKRTKGIYDFGFTIYELRSTSYDLRSTICDLRFAIYDLRSTICDLRVTIYDLRVTIYELRLVLSQN